MFAKSIRMMNRETMKILVIEDDQDVRDSIVQSLTGLAYMVDAVDNGPEGFYRAQEWKYDVIVLDVMLPGLDGWKIVDKLRSQKKHTPILMLTALSEIDHRVKGLNSGADDYLVKPYHEKELLARVRALSRRSSDMTVDVIGLGRVTVNLSDHLVCLDDEPVKLTASQYRIVACLAKRAGKIVSRNDLADIIYGHDEEKASNVVEVQIFHIRQKLGKDFLQSHRGLGYTIPKP